MARSQKLRDLDQEIGKRIRVARTLVGMSQTQLGEALGVSFQQVQKYERGANRVSGSSLWNIAEQLDQPLHFFFPPSEDGGKNDPLEPLAELRNLKANDALAVLKSLDETTGEKRRLMIDLISTLGSFLPTDIDA